MTASPTKPATTLTYAGAIAFSIVRTVAVVSSTSRTFARARAPRARSLAPTSTIRRLTVAALHERNEVQHEPVEAEQHHRGDEQQRRQPGLEVRVPPDDR